MQQVTFPIVGQTDWPQPGLTGVAITQHYSAARPRSSPAGLTSDCCCLHSSPIISATLLKLLLLSYYCSAGRMHSARLELGCQFSKVAQFATR
ncbi:hypothetical protein J6590_034529 [Homalodisca vitripennis]|nr:hypothetical protein J6590_034529 [Homalodisca vitripennis]